MARISKKKQIALSKFDQQKFYSLSEAMDVVKKVAYETFDAAVDVDVRLGVDPRKANQMVRGTVTLPLP